MERSPATLAMVRDIGMHAANKAHDAVADACQLVGDDDEMAFTIAINVIAALTCATARMISDSDTHAAKITLTLGLLAEVMTMHSEHGHDDDDDDSFGHKLSS
jgi:hypothetical protein